MLSKKAPTKKAKKDTKAAPKKVSSPFIKILSAMLLVVIAANAGIAYWAYNTWITSKEQAHLEQLANDYASKQAGVVQRYISETSKLLRTFAQREDLLIAIQDDDQATQLSIQNELRQQFSNARGIRIDKRGTIERDPDAEVPINFAEVDMINRIGRRENVFPEAVKRNEEWRINVVEAIPYIEPNAENKPPVVASLFISFSAADMLSSLGGTDLSQGNTLLLQQFQQGDPQPIVSLGQGVGNVQQEFKIPQTNWLVRFTPSSSFAEKADVSATLLVSALLIVVFASIAGCVFAAKRFSRASVARQERIAMIEKNAADASAVDRSSASNKKLLDMKVKEEDENILNLKQRDEIDPLDIVDNAPNDDGIPVSIFRSYDIRGIVPSQLSPENIVLIGKAIGSQVLASGDKAVIVGRDGRTHSDDVSEQVIEGILSTGCNVINIGAVPTPLVYFAIAELETTNSGVSVTASHNPAEYNGFKIVINNKPLVDDEIKQLHSRIVSKQFASGSGKEDFTDLSFQYIDKIVSDIALASDLKVVLDAGNGIAGDIGPKVLTEIGCELIPLHCKVDGRFPNHQPDPSVAENLQDLINKVKEEGADLGIALDGDGDRVGVVTATGQIIWPDRLLMLLAKDILSRNPGTDVLFDVKCSRELNNVISTYGGRPIMWKSGHSHMKSKMLETKALLGGELSGHLFIGERWYGFDDGVYAAARIMEIMSLREQDLDSIFESFPAPLSTPELKIPIAEESKFNFMKRLVLEGKFDEGRLTTIDGLRVDFENGWGLVRASNTSPALTLRFEADSEEALAKIKAQFKQEIQKIDADLSFEF